jgi:hypothetical protein
LLLLSAVVVVVVRKRMDEWDDRARPGAIKKADTEEVDTCEARMAMRRYRRPFRMCDGEHYD